MQHHFFFAGLSMSWYKSASTLDWLFSVHESNRLMKVTRNKELDTCSAQLNMTPYFKHSFTSAYAGLLKRLVITSNMHISTFHIFHSRARCHKDEKVSQTGEEKSTIANPTHSHLWREYSRYQIFKNPVLPSLYLAHEPKSVRSTISFLSYWDFALLPLEKKPHL